MEDRSRCELLRHLRLREHHAAVDFDVLRDLEVTHGVGLEAGLRQLDVVHRRVVIEVVRFTGQEGARGTARIERDAERVREVAERAGEDRCTGNARGAAIDEDGVPVAVDVVELREGREGPIALEEIFTVGVLSVQYHVTAPVCEVAADGDIEAVQLRIALFGLFAVEVQRDAFEVILEDEVHDAGKRVGTVNSGCTAGQHLNALDQRRRDVVDVDRAALGRRNGARPIEQDQRPVGTEAAKVDRRRAVARVVRGAVKTWHHLRHGVEQLLGVHRGRQLDLIRAQRGDRSVCFEVGPADTATGHNDFFKLRFFSCGNLRQRDAADGTGQSNGTDCRRQWVLSKHKESFMLGAWLHAMAPASFRLCVSQPQRITEAFPATAAPLQKHCRAATYQYATTSAQTLLCESAGLEATGIRRRSEYEIVL